MKYHKDIFEIIFYARGGQGAKTAAEILAQAGLKEGKYVQSFPSFGPERSGAPTRTYVRIANKPIRTKEPVIDPDVVIVLDETLLETEKNMIINLDKNEALIINTNKAAHEVAQKLNFQGRVYPVDADMISRDIVGQPRPNTVILGKIIQVTEIVKLDSLTEEFRNIFEEKIGKEMCDKNIQAIEKAYDEI